MDHSNEPLLGPTSVSWLRWLVLGLASTGMFASYYCYDNPSALQDPLQALLQINHVQYNWLYSVYSLPNVMLPLFGGVLVDRLSVNLCLVLFLSFLVVGQAVFAVGVSVKSYALVLIGRTVFGFGGESLCVAVSTLLAVWFKDKEMALAMSINSTIASLGSVANDNLSPFWYRHDGLSSALWFGFGIICVSMVFALMMISFTNFKIETSDSDRHAAPENALQLRHFAQFNLSYWLITVSCLVSFGSVLPFVNVSQSFLMEKFGYGEAEAGAIQGIPYTISAIASPFLGAAMDRFGHKASFLLVSGVLLTMAHALMAFTNLTPYLSLAILGTSYAIFVAVIWPAIACVVSGDKLGSAFGITTALQNLGMFTFPLIVGSIRDGSPSYQNVEMFFIIVGVLAVVIAIALNFEDGLRGEMLNGRKKHIIFDVNEEPNAPDA